MMGVEMLSEVISAAQSEKMIWLRGRRAFRLHGLGAFNPFMNHGDPSCALWEEGFNYERDVQADRQSRY